MAGKKGRSGGHNRKSIAEHELEGTYNVTRHKNVKAPEGKGVLVEAPANRTTMTKEQAFEMYADWIHKLGMSVESDWVLVDELATIHVAWVEASYHADQDPEAKFGNKLARNVALELGRERRILMNEFRLTPASRAVVVSSDDENEEDPVADFLSIVK